jgi:outer membrane lipoprotein carrier protein
MLKTMKRKWFLLSLLAAFTAVCLSSGEATAAPDTGLSARRIAARVQGFYDQTKVFKAGFKQRYWVKAYNKYKNSQGQVIFQKPGKMSWRYHNGNRVVSDGKLVRVYEKDNKQMYEQKINRSQYPAALSFLVGGGNLLKSFKLRKLNATRMKFEGGYVLEGVPQKPTPAYQKLLLYIDAQTHQVRRVLLLDAQGNRNRFDFITPSVNQKPPRHEFKFQPPAGTQVIKP